MIWNNPRMGLKTQNQLESKILFELRYTLSNNEKAKEHPRITPSSNETHWHQDWTFSCLESMSIFFLKKPYKATQVNLCKHAKLVTRAIRMSLP